MPTDDDLPDSDPIDEEMAEIASPDNVHEVEEVKDDADALGRDVEDPPV